MLQSTGEMLIILCGIIYRFSKRCRLFSQNGTERNDKNYGL